MILECPGCRGRYDVGGRPPGTQVRCRCGRSIAVPPSVGEADALSCPKCGAPADPAHAQCEHCRATLLRVRCARCFALLFEGHSHCPRCGAEASAPARALGSANAVRHCPRCPPADKAALVAHVVGQTLLDQCPACGGLWVDRSAFERLAAEAERQPSVVAAAFPPASQGPPPAATTWRVVYLPCPDCRELMARRNFGKRSGVILDVCPPHGLWFDADELSRVLRFVRDGGLQRARQAEVEELKAEADRARRAPAATHGTGLGVLTLGTPREPGGVHDWLDAADTAVGVVDVIRDLVDL